MSSEPLDVEKAFIKLFFAHLPQLRVELNKFLRYLKTNKLVAFVGQKHKTSPIKSLNRILFVKFGKYRSKVIQLNISVLPTVKFKMNFKALH